MPDTGESTTVRLNRNPRLFDWYLMPESFTARLVSDAIAEFGVGRGCTVLDPFCGTGTTLVAAMLEARNALGIEVNPFLAFASRTKTRTDYDLPSLRHETEMLLTAAHSVLKRMDDEVGCSAVLSEQLPDMPRLERWIARKVACKVIALRRCIEEHVSPHNRDVPVLALASILRSVSNMKLSPHAFGSREVKHDAPVLPMFERKLRKMLDDIEWLMWVHTHAACDTLDAPDMYDRYAGYAGYAGRDGYAGYAGAGIGYARVVEDDVREAGILALADMAGVVGSLLPAQLAITSPPYLNNLDYTMQTRLELFFLGFVRDMEELKALRKRMMVSDAKAMYRDVLDWQRVEEVQSIQRVAASIDERLGNRGWGWDYGHMTRQYFGGLLRAMEAVRTMLAPGAHFVMILGESAHGGVLVPVPDLAVELGRIAGYRSGHVRTLRMRRSSSHAFSLRECAVVLGV